MVDSGDQVGDMPAEGDIDRVGTALEGTALEGTVLEDTDREGKQVAEW